MSQLLQVASRRGGFEILDGVAPPTFFDQGIPYFDDEGVQRLAVQIAGVIHHYHQGLPFTADGRLAAASDKPVDRIAPGGAPFEAVTNFLVFGSGGIDHYAAGIPYTAANQLAVFTPP